MRVQTGWVRRNLPVVPAKDVHMLAHEGVALLDAQKVALGLFAVVLQGMSAHRWRPTGRVRVVN